MARKPSSNKQKTLFFKSPPQRAVGLLWGLVILLAILLFFGLRLPSSSPVGLPERTLEPPHAKIISQDPDLVLAAFPPGFPVEEGVKATEGFKYVPANSQETQSTLEYVSQKTVSQNSQIFRKFLADNNYQIVNKLEKPDLVFYYAQKDGNDLSLKIQKLEAAEIKVSVSYLER